MAWTVYELSSRFEKSRVFPLDGANTNTKAENKKLNLTLQGAHIQHFLSSPVLEHRMAVKQEQKKLSHTNKHHCELLFYIQNISMAHLTIEKKTWDIQTTNLSIRCVNITISSSLQDIWIIKTRTTNYSDLNKKLWEIRQQEGNNIINVNMFTITKTWFTFT